MFISPHLFIEGCLKGRSGAPAKDQREMWSSGNGKVSTSAATIGT